MQLRLKNLAQVRLFAVTVTAVALTGVHLLQLVIYPPDLWQKILVTSTVITISMASPIAYFVGLKIAAVERLTAQLEHAVNHDALTATCSRLRFYEEVGKARRWPMMLIATDIDHFKQVNDRYGHQAGDAALRQFAQSLIRNCREDDIVARFGGEEFIILLRAETEPEALATAERLRDCVAAREFVLDAQVVQMTASFGVAPAFEAAAIDRGLHAADLALYRAKRMGRNRVCAYDPLLDGATPAPEASEPVVPSSGSYLVSRSGPRSDGGAPDDLSDPAAAAR
ncbi:GGDEF domain-containing protein [Roseovarius sp. C7]|uniref:GGDEF domain-containing protein n=1 Tax=Roseovarius sp. C7 TaxID=3398643 RepID=UPI0039F5103D